VDGLPTGTSDSQATGSGSDEHDLRRRSIDTIRGLAMDAVQKANAGHPGTAMALAPLAYVLFKRFLRVNPADTEWPDRDRFVLSAGHAMRAAVLADAPHRLRPESPGPQEFRQWAHARRVTPSAATHRASRSPQARSGRVSATPWASRCPSASSPSSSTVRATHSRPSRVRDLLRRRHDGGISQEAASVAGNFALGKLVLCYDDNHITIDGSTTISFDGEDHAARMQANGWHVQRVADSEDVEALTAAISAARRKRSGRPS